MHLPVLAADRALATTFLWPCALTVYLLLAHGHGVVVDRAGKTVEIVTRPLMLNARGAALAVHRYVAILADITDRVHLARADRGIGGADQRHCIGGRRTLCFPGRGGEREQRQRRCNFLQHELPRLFYATAVFGI